ncbi:MAG: nuclear transport factor 2 family protein [Porticoccaceae bacterium]|nr:nuclear transport factor 2 family protein [Pseudomonadales bacterium]MCP5172881.1 nuclear transport factor 2 family protein [Pseudomonadales bacterium]MCP5302355.1 nuclear transport factor 2 family protein [Pseudomonadales bacterium]
MDLEQRITRLEDIEAIKQLKARYCEISDDMHNPDRITSIFTEDAIWECPDFGKAVGHQAIRQQFISFQKMFSFSQHNVTNPIIAIDGNRAEGTWYIIGPWTNSEDGKEMWMTAKYEERYVKAEGQWKFQHVKVVVRMVADR